MLWAFLAVLSGLGDATVWTIMKALHGKVTRRLVMAAQFGFGVPLLWILAFFFFPENLNYNVIWIGGINAILFTLASYLLLKAAQKGVLSKTMPLLSLTPLFLLITSYFMINELPGFYGFLGVTVIVIGTYIANLQKESKNIFAPFLALAKNKTSFYLLAVSFLFSITANFFKMGISMSNPIFFVALNFTLVSLILSPLLISRLREEFSSVKKNFKLLFSIGIVMALTEIFAAFAMMLTVPSYMVALKRSSVIFIVFFGYFFFKEKGIKQALIGSILMVIGGALILLF